MTEKPEALRLAEFYEALAEEPPKSPDNSKIRAAAAGLRRLSAVEAQRDALLEALQALYDEQQGPPLIRHQAAWEAAMEMARAAIKVVEGENT